MLTITLLGSTLHHFESLHTEYSSSHTLKGNGVESTLFEYPGFKPFKVTLYDLMDNSRDYMCRPTTYKGTYYLLGLEEGIDLLEPERVVIHLPINKEEWSKVRVIVMKDEEYLLDTTSPLSDSMFLPTHMDIQSGLYKASSHS